MELVINIGYASPSIIQRTFKGGYARDGRIIDQLELLEIISGYNGSKPRDVLITKNEFKELRKNWRFNIHIKLLRLGFSLKIINENEEYFQRLLVMYQIYINIFLNIKYF